MSQHTKINIEEPSLVTNDSGNHLNIKTELKTPNNGHQSLVPVLERQMYDAEETDIETKQQFINQVPFGINRLFLFTVIIIYAICVGSHYFNWTPWETILKKNGAFEELCFSNDICEAQEKKIASLLPLISALMFSFTFLAGMILDIIGPKVCCLFGNTLLISGWICLFFASETCHTYSIGFGLIASGTDPAFFGTLSIANLFPGYSSTVISILGAARSVSNILPVIMETINASFPQFTFNYMALTFVVIYFICSIIVIMLIPANPYRALPGQVLKKSDDAYEMVTFGTNHCCCQSESNTKTGELKKTERSPLSTTSEIGEDLLRQLKSLWRNIWSPLFTPIVIVNVVNMIRNNFYLTSASKQLGEATNFLSVVNMLAFIPGPILGLIVDKVGSLEVIVGLNTTNMLVFVAVLIAQLSTSSVLIRIMSYSSTLLAFPGIGFLLSQIYCYISVVFPPGDMGKLSGLSSCVAGIVALCVNPMYTWSIEARSFWQMDVVNIAISIVSYGCIGFLMWRVKRRY